jgi:hypothetical protein
LLSIIIVIFWFIFWCNHLIKRVNNKIKKWEKEKAFIWAMNRSIHWPINAFIHSFIYSFTPSLSLLALCHIPWWGSMKITRPLRLLLLPAAAIAYILTCWLDRWLLALVSMIALIDVTCAWMCWMTYGSGVYNGLLWWRIYWVVKNTRNARPYKKLRADNRPATGRNVNPVASISSIISYHTCRTLVKWLTHWLNIMFNMISSSW